jgi:hypothetical protein
VRMGSLRAGRLDGTVIDPSGSVIPQARVQVQIRGSEKIVCDLRADGQGHFHLPHLRPGRYWMGVSSGGLTFTFGNSKLARTRASKTCASN